MNDSEISVSRDGRLTVILLFLFGLLLCDLVTGTTFFSLRENNECASCQQLHFVEPDRLVVDNCMETGKEHEYKVSARFSPFLFAAMPINSADKDMLMTVDGIGPALAEDIIAYRRQIGQFSRSSDLLNIPGIGPKRADRFASAFIFAEEP